MNYRSVADLSRTIRANLHRVPNDVDLVVGVPRSGVLAGSLVALGLNVRLIDLPAFVASVGLAPDNVRATRTPALASPVDARHVLVVDDSLQSGRSLARVRDQLAPRCGQRVSYCVVYAAPGASAAVDLAFEEVALPRLFEWNVMHRQSLAQCCVDIDGVLCPDPTQAENDDGEAYARFLREVRASVLPSYEIGHLVTARLEKYRGATEAWLARNGIRYRQLHMLDLPDAKSRRAGGAHAAFKAAVYRAADDASLFIESNPVQADEIARHSGKPVLCYARQSMIMPTTQDRIRTSPRRVAAHLRRRVARMLRLVLAR